MCAQRLEDVACQQKDSTGRGGWVRLKGKNSMVVSVIGCRRAWLDWKGHFRPFQQLRNKPSYLVEFLFPAFKANFSAMPELPISVIGVCG